VAIEEVASPLNASLLFIARAFLPLKA
jgi:hypothetical protein